MQFLLHLQTDATGEKSEVLLQVTIDNPWMPRHSCLVRPNENKQVYWTASKLHGRKQRLWIWFFLLTECLGSLQN